MSADITYLAYTALLTAILWIPYIIGQVAHGGMLTAEQYRDISLRWEDMPPWLQRANRAHINAVESFAPFAVLVLIAHSTGISNATTEIAAAIYFWSRLAHAIVFLAGIPYLRTLLFVVGFGATIVIGWQVVA